MSNEMINVPRELLDAAAEWLEHLSSPCSAERTVAQDVRALLDAMRGERDYWMEKCTNGGNPVYQVMSLTDGQGWHDVTLERYQVAKSVPEFNKVRVLYGSPVARHRGD